MTETVENWGEQGLLGELEYAPVIPNTLTRVQALVAGYDMAPHAQAWVDACREVTGASSYGTYPGHGELGPAYAVDTFSPVPTDRRTPGTPGLWRVLGDEVADFALETMRNGNPYGVYYAIWKQHIYNPSIADYWRLMENRGGDTQNHFDHVHVSFNRTASGSPTPSTPNPTAKEFAKMEITYIVAKEDWVLSSSLRYFGKLPFSDTLKTLKKEEVLQDLGPQSAEFHRGILTLATQAGFTGMRLQ